MSGQPSLPASGDCLWARLMVGVQGRHLGSRSHFVSAAGERERGRERRERRKRRENRQEEGGKGEGGRKGREEKIGGKIKRERRREK